MKKESLFLASEIKNTPKLFGIPTGIEGFDDLFFTVEIKEDKAIKKPLGGIPYLSVVNITGIPDTGKSIFAEQFTLTQAYKGYKVVFVTVESPAPFLVSALKYRSKVLGIPWEEVEDNIVVLDVASNNYLLNNLDALLKTLDEGIEEYDTKSVVVDSITGLYESREMLARSIVRKLFNFLKEKRQTAILVSQKRSSHEELTAEAAGGYAISHIVDCSVVLSKEIILTRYLSSLYKLPLGNVIRLLRIDGCRLCGHESKTYVFEITPLGIIKVLMPLEDFIRRDVDGYRA